MEVEAEVELSDSFGDVVVSCDVSVEVSCERACDVLLTRMLGGCTTFGKGINGTPQ